MDQPTIELISKDIRNVLEKLISKYYYELKNVTIDVAPGCIKGDNYLGIIAKATVRSNNKNDQVYNFIVKSAPRTGLMRSIIPITQLYRREIYIYETVLSEFKKFQHLKRISKPFDSFAPYHASLIDENNEAIIMENMKELGFKLWDRLQPYDYNHILLAIKEYGKLHAICFALRDQKPDLFKDLANNLENVNFMDGGMEEVFRIQGQRALNTLDPVRNKIAYKSFENFLSVMLVNIKNLLKSNAAGKYAVVTHGDSWINNILYKYEDNTKPSQPSKLCFLDWQLSGLGSPVRDLSYLIFSSTDKKMRDEKYDILIREYYNSFSTFLIELESDPQLLFPFEVLEEHLKRFSLYGLFMTVSVLYVTTREVENIPDMNELNMKSVKENFLAESQTVVSKYNARMRDIILDFVRFGYLEPYLIFDNNTNN